jgi:hypothetical protein
MDDSVLDGRLDRSPPRKDYIGMTRLAALAAFAALAFASSAFALGGSVGAHISANWGTPGQVQVTVLSNHSFNGTVRNTCVPTGVGTKTDETQPLSGWVWNAVAHLYQIDTTFDISAAGSGASCIITVMDGHKQLAQQGYVSV